MTTAAIQMPGHPVVGNLLNARRNFLHFFGNAAGHGDIVRMRFLHRVGYLLVRPEDIKHVLVDNYKNYGKQTRGYQVLRISLGQGLVTSEGDFWRRQRRIAQPAFHHQSISGFADVMVECASMMLDRWSQLGDGSVVEIDDEMMKVTLQIVGLCLLTRDFSGESDAIGSNLTAMLEETVYRIPRVYLPPLWVPTARNRRINRALSEFDAMVMDVIAARRAEASTDRKPDLLDMLMRATDEETGESMSDGQLRDELVTMVSAGHETTANTLSWTLHLLAENPEADKKLQDELQSVLGDRLPTLQDLPQLPYLEAVVKESMRILPAVWMIARSAIGPDEIGGVSIEAGAMVFVSQWVTHRDARYFPEPLAFKPERFLDGSVEAQHKYAYWPFSGGPRVCIGNSFAMMEARLILAAMRQRFHFENTGPVEPEPTVTLRPKGGLRMRLRKN